MLYFMPNLRKNRAKSKPASKAGFSRPKKAQSPPKIALNSPELRQLTQKWYNKLADEGFKDIEGYTTVGLREGPINGASLKNFADNFRPETRHYYACLRNYLTHNSQILDVYGADIGPTKRLALELYSEGMPYRQILDKLKGRKGHPLNLRTLSVLVNYFCALARSWNKKNVNGLDFEAPF